MSTSPSTALERVLVALKSQAKHAPKTIFNYVVPSLWNAQGYSGKEAISTPEGNLIVNPFSFYIDVVEKLLKFDPYPSASYSQSISNLTKDTSKGDWIAQAVAYSMMPRASAAYDHDRTGKLEDANMYGLKETGTFIKTLALLPYLKEMGVTLMYLLPIASYTRMYKKGDMGSPYGVKDFYTIDQDLFDPITGDELTVNDQFKAFVEACHRLGMRVALDFIPRTNARDSKLALDHPDWFYWIKKKDEVIYKTPWVEGVKKLTVPEPEHAPFIYTSPEVLSFIDLFQENPKSATPEKWAKIQAKLAEHPELNHLEVIEEIAGLTVAPAFADVMNDPQPAWSDVTFFRLYLDDPVAAQKILKKKHNPYMLFDVAKSSLNPGSIPNQPLWDTLADIIPFYQREFGIDGMRIDMGHALPEALTHLIIGNARKLDPNFCFIAEELQGKRAEIAKSQGYNMIIGDGFYMEPRLSTFEYHGFAYTSTQLPCPVFACAETHDTPRIAARDGGRVTAKLLTALNLFTPNTVPFINSGQELYEIQPINTGLDCRPNEALLLSKKDPFYGKLALFDKYAFHYTQDGAEELPKMIQSLTKLRNANLPLFTNKANYVPIWFSSPRDPAVGFGYVDTTVKQPKEAWVVLGHTHLTQAETIIVDLRFVYERLKTISRKAQLVFSTHESSRAITEFNFDANLSLWMQPGEVKIIKITL